MSDWTPTPVPDDEGEYPRGTRVIVREGMVGEFRTGLVTGWATGTSSLAMYQATGNPECLVDSEGPLVRYDDQDPADETLDWFPGQAMFVIERFPC